MAKGTKAANVVRLRPRAVANPWTARIVAAYERTRDGFFEMGRLLVAAKADLPHGEFVNMIERELPFGRRYANMLMCIATDKRLGKHASHLPASGATLYELTKLDDSTFHALLRAGVINQSTQRSDIQRANLKALVKADEQRVAGLIPARGRFRTLIIDPPWEKGARDLPYATMSQAELEDPRRLPVKDWLAGLFIPRTAAQQENRPGARLAGRRACYGKR